MKQDISNLTGKLLISMPHMADPRFVRSVIFICAHDQAGAMGLTINVTLPNLNFGTLLKQFDIQIKNPTLNKYPVLSGGPVDPVRGFLIHTADFVAKDTIIIDHKFGVSGTIESLTDVANGKGSKDMLFLLGYAGWGSKQLETEIAQNAWLVCPADYDLVFGTGADAKWERALWRMGIDPAMLSTNSGRA
jgi:putative transcriptional regulator